MTRIPRTRQRRLALAGMVCVLPLAAFLWLISGLAVSGVFENLEPDSAAQAERFVVLATIVATAALTALVGLAIRRRGVAVVGSFAVSGSALAVLVDLQLTSPSGNAGTIVAVPVAVVCIGLVGIWAALAPSPAAPVLLAAGREAKPDPSGAARPSP